MFLLDLITNALFSCDGFEYFILILQLWLTCAYLEKDLIPFLLDFSKLSEKFAAQDFLHALPTGH